MSTVSVPRRRLGTRGPMVPVLSLGSWNTWDRMTPDDAVTLLRAAMDAGAASFDVARYNMGPHAENAATDLRFRDAVARASIERDDYHLTGKLWLWEYPETGFREQIRDSLARIGTDHADDVVVGDHEGDLDVERVVSEVNELIDEGCFRTWGVNNWHVDETRRAVDYAGAHGLVGPCFAQLKYSVARRSMAEGAPYAELFRAGLGLQASDVLEGGILAGKRRLERKIGADVGSIRERIIATAPAVARIAEEFHASPAQVALAFTLTHPSCASVLFGASSLSQFKDNLGALSLLERVGAQALRQACEGLQCDDRVPADGTWPSA